ncbi:hypothetical protein BROUX41_004952 [Berkeleyomyces rouxiae]|uniref:uncharacterized protein n=1 Tax=Berkeleyomyces rouxiae TaxID=2035830 RepID=UPI003B76AC98
MDVTVPQDEPVQLSADEKKVLALYDQLERLRLETAIIKAQQAHVRSSSSSRSSVEVTPDQVREGKEKLLKAKSRYAVQKEIVDSVLMMYPVLRAVHQGTFCSPIERDLTPHLMDRDSSSFAASKNAMELQAVLEKTTTVQAKALKEWNKNAELASDVQELAHEVTRQKEEPLNTTENDDELDQLKADVKSSRYKWMVMKGTASAVVTGSGVDWAHDPALLEVVLEPEDID